MNAGEIAWEFTQEPDWAVTSSGRRTLARRDIRVRTGEREDRGVLLGDGFWLVLPFTSGRCVIRTEF